MKIKECFSLRQLGANTFVIEAVNVAGGYNKIVTFNSTAAFLWETLYGHEFTLDDLANCIVREYKIEAVDAKQDASTLIDKWKEAGLIDQ